VDVVHQCATKVEPASEMEANQSKLYCALTLTLSLVFVIHHESSGLRVKHFHLVFTQIARLNGRGAASMSGARNLRDSQHSETVLSVLSYTDRSARIRSETVSGSEHEIHYIEYLGNGPPPPHVGFPGDIYLDSSSQTHDFYGRMMTTWIKWAGSLHDAVHPLWPNVRLVWCDASSAPTWEIFTPLPSSQQSILIDPHF
jgi:hypothetical protein